MTALRARHSFAVGIVALVMAGCTSMDQAGDTNPPNPSGAGFSGPSSPSPSQLAALRQAASLAACPPANPHRPAASDLPELDLACLGGGPDVNVAGLTGKPYVVNFWASDCPPCKEEGPYLQAMYEAADGAFGVLGVNFLDPGGESGALAGAREFGMRFPILFDPDGLLGKTFDVPGLPVTFFLDAEGSIVGQQPGAFASADELEDAIETHLGIRR
jgi:thiol-disulfide isomerase/thioredoxin